MLAALLADMLIPLHLINIRRCDLREREAGRQKLLDALQALRMRPGGQDSFVPAAVSRQPMEANFFPYIQQLPGGASASLAARDVFDWARQLADELAFGGSSIPGFRARIALKGAMVTLLSVYAYRRNPSAQIPLDVLSARAPFAKLAERRKIVAKLNRLLPQAAQISADKVDRRPAVSLRCLCDAQRRADFKRLISEMAAALRAEA